MRLILTVSDQRKLTICIWLEFVLFLTVRFKIWSLLPQFFLFFSILIFYWPSISFYDGVLHLLLLYVIEFSVIFSFSFYYFILWYWELYILFYFFLCFSSFWIILNFSFFILFHFYFYNDLGWCCHNHFRFFQIKELGSFTHSNSIF